MKKLVCLLAILALATSLCATEIQITAEDAGSGQLRIGYNVTDGATPKGISVKLTIANGQLDKASDVAYVDSFFDVYVDYLNVNADPCDPNTVRTIIDAGTGHPIAKQDSNGVPTFPTSAFSLCLAALDDANKAVAVEPNLVVLQLCGTTTAVVTFTTDTKREIAGPYDTVTLPSPVSVSVSSCGQPCWKDCQPCGDYNNDCEISSADVLGLLGAWPPKDYDACADFDHNGEISSADVLKLLAHWPPKEQCPAGEGCSPCTP